MLVAASGATTRGEVIDRVLAVVAGQIITLSDARGALALGLIAAGRPLSAPAAPAAPAADEIQRALGHLIDRELMLVEARRFAPPEPDAADVERRLAEARARFASEAAFDAALAAHGLDRARLAQIVRDTLRIDAYLADRFATTVQPTDEEVREYLNARRAELPAVAERLALDLARERLTAERRRALIADWLNGLRRRTAIIELYLPGRP